MAAKNAILIVEYATDYRKAGMAVNAVLGTLFVPNFWELFENFREKYLSKMFSGSNVVAPPSKDNDSSSAGDI